MKASTSFPLYFRSSRSVGKWHLSQATSPMQSRQRIFRLGMSNCFACLQSMMLWQLGNPGRAALYATSSWQNDRNLLTNPDRRAPNLYTLLNGGPAAGNHVIGVCISQATWLESTEESPRAYDRIVSATRSRGYRVTSSPLCSRWPRTQSLPLGCHPELRVDILLGERSEQFPLCSPGT